MFGPNPSSANVIACLALFVALGGTATAAVTLDRDLRGELKVTEDENADHLAVPMCNGTDLSACPNRLELALSSDARSGRQANWLIQARLHVSIGRAPLEQPRSGVANRCGLVDTSAAANRDAVLDETQVGATVRPSSENVALSAVVPKRLRNPSVALRCTSQTGDRVEVSFIKITALKVGTVTGA
jgi:hypothetical protein